MRDLKNTGTTNNAPPSITAGGEGLFQALRLIAARKDIYEGIDDHREVPRPERAG